MLRIGRDRLIDAGSLAAAVQCNAEQLPFCTDAFDCVSIAFGLRNVTRKDLALAEMRRVVRPGGRVLVLEFSRVWEPRGPLYDAYSFSVLPALGKLVAKDAESYRYLAESIRMFPSQEELKLMMERAGFDKVDYFNLTAGLVALHVGVKF
jgi:demethylmenaquinone methyltransferase/2-methoxy-6-polyprenyl-1,4-benzoquinol methylase